MTVRFQTNVLMKQYGDYISLYQNVPRVYMPVFWAEQKFLLDSGKASQVRFAINLPFIGQSIGGFLFLLGVILMSVSQLKKIFCANEKSKNLLEKLEANGNGAVIKDYEMNPLMDNSPMSTNCCK